MREDGLRASLGVVLLVGAANFDATPAQREELRGVVDILRDHSLPAGESYREAVLLVGRVMGSTWRPRGAWDQWLIALLEEQGGAGMTDKPSEGTF